MTLPIKEGQTFGPLVALRKAERKGSSAAARWWFRCHCGSEFEQRVAHVVNRRVLGCGCLSDGGRAIKIDEDDPATMAWALRRIKRLERENLQLRQIVDKLIGLDR